MKKRVLIVPAWYPASFFTEQLDLMEKEYDFRILTGEREKISKMGAVKNLAARPKSTDAVTNYRKDESGRSVTNLHFQYAEGLSNRFEIYQYRMLEKKMMKHLNNLYSRDWRPDLVHIFSLSDLSLFVCKWAKKNHIPVVLTEHLIYIRRHVHYFQKKKEEVYKQVDCLLSVSNYVLRNLLTSGAAPKAVKIIGNFVNDAYTGENTPKVKQNGKILYVATHLHDKDIHILFDAISLLKENSKHTFGVDIIGLESNTSYDNSSGEVSTLAKEIEMRHLNESIQIIGKLKRNELLKSLRNYSMLVSTSRSETFGIAVAEAILHGLPVVVTDSGGIREFVHERNGIITDVRDAEAVAEGIRKILDNDIIFDTEKNSNEIQLKYGREAFRKSISDVYGNLIKNEMV